MGPPSITEEAATNPENPAGHNPVEYAKPIIADSIHHDRSRQEVAISTQKPLGRAKETHKPDPVKDAQANAVSSFRRWLSSSGALHLSDFLRQRLGNDAFLESTAADAIKAGFEAIYHQWEETRHQREERNEWLRNHIEVNNLKEAARERPHKESQWYDQDGVETEIGSTNFSIWSGSTAAFSTGTLSEPGQWKHYDSELLKLPLYGVEENKLLELPFLSYASFIPASLQQTALSPAQLDSELPAVGLSVPPVEEPPVEELPVEEPSKEPNEEEPLNHDCDGRSPESTSASNTSDLSGLSDFFPDIPRFLSAESAAIDELVEAYHAWAQANAGTSTARPARDHDHGDTPEPSSSHPGNTSFGSERGSTAGTSATSSTQLGSGSGFPTAPRHGNGPQKRRRDDDDDDDEFQKPKPPKRKRIEAGSRRLACLFQKRYPSKHLFCGTGGAVRGFETIARLKEHIRRRHVRSPIYCPRCKKVFEGSEAKDQHVLQGMSAAQPCEERLFEDETALAWQASLASLFKSRVDKALSIHEQWFSLWANIFPGAEPPSSCLVDDPVCEHLLEYYEFTRARGTEVVRESVRSSGFLPESISRDADCYGQETTFTELEAFAERVFDQAAERIFRDFHSHREAACVARQEGGSANRSQQRPSGESGEASSSGQGSQGGPPTPATVDPQHLGLQIHDTETSDELPFEFGSLDGLGRFDEGYDPPWFYPEPPCLDSRYQATEGPNH
ncbi:hypothetical protein B0T16DRAFT_516378 [Cercophora newfieldiana]|uniref:C2H2-type domain-containing protein n=1 Tax=Cercophora newfieldiana TaxID=92897 RepID=A0AA40CKL4_9PEZI|nr:hypothetical protein B0T16DRAFT_516378 [Cercophora newfieldiana]